MHLKKFKKINDFLRDEFVFVLILILQEELEFGQTSFDHFWHLWWQSVENCNFDV